MSNEWITRCFRVMAKAGGALLVSETPSRLAVRIEVIGLGGKTAAVELTSPQWTALVDLGRGYGRDTVEVRDEPEMTERVRAAGLDVPALLSRHGVEVADARARLVGMEEAPPAHARLSALVELYDSIAGPAVDADFAEPL